MPILKILAFIGALLVTVLFFPFVFVASWLLWDGSLPVNRA
jgi:hypothetical protein